MTSSSITYPTTRRRAQLLLLGSGATDGDWHKIEAAVFFDDQGKADGAVVFFDQGKADGDRVGGKGVEKTKLGGEVEAAVAVAPSGVEVLAD